MKKIIWIYEKAIIYIRNSREILYPEFWRNILTYEKLQLFCFINVPLALNVLTNLEAKEDILKFPSQFQKRKYLW